MDAVRLRWAVALCAIVCVLLPSAAYADQSAPWAPQSIQTTGDLIAASAISTGTAWVCGDNDVVLATSDGGQTWLRQSTGLTTAGYPATLIALDFVDPSHGWAAGSLPSQPIMRTTDGGATWTAGAHPSRPFWCWNIKFTDAQNGWAVGMDYAPATGGIIHTADGGATWSWQVSNEPRTLCGVDF